MFCGVHAELGIVETSVQNAYSLVAGVVHMCHRRLLMTSWVGSHCLGKDFNPHPLRPEWPLPVEGAPKLGVGRREGNWELGHLGCQLRPSLVKPHHCPPPPPSPHTHTPTYTHTHTPPQGCTFSNQHLTLSFFLTPTTASTRMSRCSVCRRSLRSFRRPTPTTLTRPSSTMRLTRPSATWRRPLTWCAPPTSGCRSPGSTDPVPPTSHPSPA